MNISFLEVNLKEAEYRNNLEKLKELLIYFENDEDTLKMVKTRTTPHLERMDLANRISKIKDSLPKLGYCALIHIENEIVQDERRKERKFNMEN